MILLPPRSTLFPYTTLFRSSVVYTVTFSESVSGVDAADFALALSGVSTTPPLVIAGSGTTYTVTGYEVHSTGILSLTQVDDDPVHDEVGNSLGGTGASNGDFTGQVYTIV